MEKLTNSRLKAYRLCPEFHHRTYVQGWRPRAQSSALTFGSAFHAAMETYWGDQTVPSGLEDPTEDAKLRALVQGYYARWTGEDDKYETLAVEQEFDLPLVHPVTGAEHPVFRLAGKIDLIVADGDLVILGEHKTSSEDISPGSHYWRRLDLDTQILIYLHACREKGYEASQILYDVAAKPKQRLKKNESVEAFGRRVMEEIAEDPSAYYARGTLTRTDEQINAALLDAWDYADRIQRDRVEGWHPRNVDSCHKYGRPCSFFDCCSYGTAPNDMLFVRSDDVNPELSDKEAA